MADKNFDYLDKNGVLFLWNTIKQYIAGEITELDLANTFATKVHKHAVSDLDSVSVTAAEINTLSGATGNLQQQINTLPTSATVDAKVKVIADRLDALIGTETAGAIDTFNEIKDFLAGISGTTLQDIMDGIDASINNAGFVKQTQMVPITNAEIEAICV